MGAAAAPAPRAPRERFAIRLGVATSLAELVQWFDGAAVGDTAVYASGFTLPREHESVKQARAWSDHNAAHLTQRRDPDDRRRWLYEITRSDGAGKPAAQRAIAATGDLAREQMKSLMQELRRAAERGLPCPSYAAMTKHIALRADGRGRRRARYLIERLQSEKQISVIAGDASHPPVITILAAGRARGKSTKGAE